MPDFSLYYRSIERFEKVTKKRSKKLGPSDGKRQWKNQAYQRNSQTLMRVLLCGPDKERRKKVKCLILNSIFVQYQDSKKDHFARFFSLLSWNIKIRKSPIKKVKKAWSFGREKAMKERMSWSLIICLRHSFRDWSRKVNEQGGKRKEIKEREIIIYKQKKRCFDHSFFLSDSLALNLPNLSRVASLWTYIWNVEYLRS